MTGPEGDAVTSSGEPPADGVRYAATVYAVGELIPQFREQGLLIYFGELAPSELHDFVIRHRTQVVHSAPEPGDLLEIDGVTLPITAVGGVVAANLLGLGHFSLKADGATSAPMPGDICVELGELPLPRADGTLRILVGADASRRPDEPNPEEKP